MVLGLVAAVVLANGSVVKALGMVVLGLLLGMIGTDVNSGVARFSFDIPELTDGVEFAVVAMGMFGFAEIILNLEQKEDREHPGRQDQGPVARLRPTSRPRPGRSLRGTALGSVLGILPGGGATLSAFASYALEKKMSKTPERFGKGAIEGVAGPEAANNAGAQMSFVPMLTLGLPTNAVMALMIAAMMIHNIQPGPQVMSSNPTLFWGLIVSMWIGNLMLVILNLPLIGLWIKLLTIPYRLLYPAILLFCCIGAYSVNNNVVRRDDDDPVRHPRLRVQEARLRAGTAAAGLRAGQADGGVPAPGADHLARRPHGVPHPAAVADAADHRRGAAGAGVQPEDCQEAGRGLRGGVIPVRRPVIARARDGGCISDALRRATLMPTDRGARAPEAQPAD